MIDVPKIPADEAHHRLVEFLLQVCRRDKAQLKLMPSVTVRSSLSKFLESKNKEYQRTALEFLTHFADRE